MVASLRTVLVVDADAAFVAELAGHLGRAGLEVVVAVDGEDGLAFLETEEPDLVVLDLDLPRIGGIDVCRRIRARSSVPILVVTSRTDEVDTALAFELGADGYVVKPATSREVLARVRTLVGRARGASRNRATPLRAGGLVVDDAAHRVTLDGRAVDLTLKEFRLLHMLVEQRGRVLTRRALLERVWGPASAQGDVGTLDAHVKRIRAKLGESAEASRITTVRGLGYRFDED